MAVTGVDRGAAALLAHIDHALADVEQQLGQDARTARARGLLVLERDLLALASRVRGWRGWAQRLAREGLR